MVENFFIRKKWRNFAPAFDAQMAESVDALVSNTNGVTPVPVRPRLWVRLIKRKVLILRKFQHLVFILLEHFDSIDYYGVHGEI